LDEVESDPADVIIEKADSTSRDINRTTRKSTIIRIQITFKPDFCLDFYDLRKNPIELKITCNTVLYHISQAEKKRGVVQEMSPFYALNNSLSKAEKRQNKC